MCHRNLSRGVKESSVPGFVVFDLPGAPISAGGTRLAPDVSVAEVALLARAMTYKFAALGDRVAGAKAGVRGDPASRLTRLSHPRPEIKSGSDEPISDAGRVSSCWPCEP
jgi:glutamate dehydrogenase (NAD(P)+)